ncbi:nuclear transport factor 2 family protein [Streptomyces sp. NPDC006296]|uniref:nuclear transport factor 2 family protein n=1 Tax=Streptomyces sp. NPDC006296 TaxID=3156746 RepID=UPI0033BCEA5A
MSNDLENKVLAYLQALEQADWAAARALCDGTATVWHNDGKGDETLEQYFEGLKKQIGLYRSIHYDIIRRFSRPGGVLQQHVVRVITKTGERGGVHAAVHFAFDDAGLITRIEAYAHYIPEGPTS